MNRWKGYGAQRLVWAFLALLVISCVAVAAIAGTIYYRTSYQTDLTIDLIPEEGYLVQRVVPLEPAQARTVALGASSGGAYRVSPQQMSSVLMPPMWMEDQYGVVWNTDTQVEIFKTTYENAQQQITVAGKNGDKVIAPGAQNDYTFSLRNNTRGYVDYKMTMSAAVEGLADPSLLPVEVRVKGINGWVVGDDENWIPVLELNTAADTGVSNAHYSAVYTLEWRWPYEHGQDELDTWLGNQEQEITLTIGIATTAIFHPGGNDDEDEDGELDVDVPTGGGGGSENEDIDPPVVPPITDPVPDVLRPEKEAGHQAYIYGYEDGTLRPEANITRAEVAAIFYRLLRDEVREEHDTLACDYPDVPLDSWYRAEVSTLTGMGMLEGYPDGSFRPNDPISRAELTAIVSRFSTPKWSADRKTAFVDIEGHWANAEIRSVEDKNWIIGYPDGTFRPDNTITRAETVTIVNRMLHRLPERFEDLLEEMPVWPDNQDRSMWYFMAMQEAAVGHTYEYLVGTREHWITLLDHIPEHD